MKRLPTTLRIGDFTHEQIQRDDRFAIYSQKGDDSDHLAYEVIRIQTHGDGKIPNGDGTFREIEAGETYPKAHHWGREGWTFSSLVEAQRRLSELGSIRTAEEGSEGLESPTLQ
jgi:hypothetical protein